MDLSTYRTIRVATVDINGQMRGKRVPASYGAKLEKGAVRMPYSALNVDIFGCDIENSPLVFDSGDADGVMRPTNRGAVPMPWLATPSALVPMWMYHDDGSPFMGDPRHALSAILDRYAAHGWRVVAATEMEFHLADDSGETLAPPTDPITGRKIDQAAVLSLPHLDAFDAFFTDLYDGCADMDIPAQAAISEGGIGQFEINLNHTDALRCADDAVLFKSLVKGLARKHGFAATFMAKPFADDAGNGMHVHFSVLDGDGRNIFDDGSDTGSDLLRHAVAGCLAAMPASGLIFAPHANSYDRLVPNSHAPTGVAWGYDNRTTSIRIPGGAPVARRIEHRVAGGDINPYLMLSVVLGAALIGIEDTLTAPAPITGNAYGQDLDQLPNTWQAAIEAFENSSLIARILPADLIQNICITKHQERSLMAKIAPSEHWKTYLETV